MKRFGLAASLLVLLLASPARGDLDKNAKKWLDDVRPILLPEEEKAYKGLKSNADAAEFQRKTKLLAMMSKSNASRQRSSL